MFPQVEFKYEQTLVFKFYMVNAYLGLVEDNGSPRLITKQLNDQDISEDKDIQFHVSFYTAAEAQETKLILPMHKSTGHFLRMTSDRTLSIVSKDEIDNLVESPLPPRQIKRADDRFFYLKNAGPGDSNYVLEAMNGRDYNHVVTVFSEGSAPQLTLTSGGEANPMEAYIQLQDSVTDM